MKTVTKRSKPRNKFIKKELTKMDVYTMNKKTSVQSA